METPNGIPKDAKIDLHGLPVEVAKVAVQALKRTFGDLYDLDD
jgi:DNA-nicking Smr family endonuclease